MKKFIVYLTIVLASAEIVMTPHKAQAADWGVGLYTFYAWWEPSFKDKFDNFEWDKSRLYGGPAISVTFAENWTLATVMYFELDTKKLEYDYSGTGSSSGADYNIHIKSNPCRWDLDISMTYKINQQFKVFTGFKANEIVTTADSEQYQDDEVTITSPFTKSSGGWDMEGVENYGPALGINFSIPVAENTALILSTSVFYTISEFSINEYYESSPYVIEAKKLEYNYTGRGNNSTVTLSYFIEPMSTALSIGGRFQFFNYQEKGDSPSLSNDYFYGITASAMFFF